MSAIANEVNLNVISNYSDGEFEIDSNSFNNSPINSPLLAGGEGMVDDHNHDSDSFSSTTTASFSADMAIGAVDGASNEAVTAIYGYQIDLNTSFTGEDSFDVSLDAGSGAASLGELDLNSTGDVLTVDGISYTFPLGDNTTVFVGDGVDGSTLYSTACVYGGHTVQLDDCGNSGAAMAAGLGTAFGASYDFGNGFTAALGYEGPGASTAGLMTKEGRDVYGGQVTYTGDSYGLSLTYSDFENASSEYAYTALNGYYTPEGSLPSISAGYEVGETSTTGAKDTSQWMLGLQWDELGAGTLGAAIGTYGHINEGATEYYMYEAFYSYPMNDGMTITPIVFVKETSGLDQTGLMVKTSFSF
jgi:hypothetical protein